MFTCAAVAGAAETNATHDHSMHSHGAHSMSNGSPPATVVNTILSNATISFGWIVYTPNTVTINAGESVTWNGEFQFHPLIQVQGPDTDEETPGGFGNNTGTTYTHTFPNPGTYYFACLFHGTFGGTMRGEVIVNAAVSVPDGVDANTLRLTVAPNPTFTAATVSFNLPRAMNTDVTVYDLSGALVNTLQHGTLPAGAQRVSWNGKNSAGQNVGSGIYFVRLTGEKLRVQAKLVKLR